MAGIALAAIKALNDQVENNNLIIRDLERENSEIKMQNAELTERLTQLEKLIESLMNAN